MILSKLKEPSVLKIIIPLSAVVVVSRAFPYISFIYYLLPLLFPIFLYAGYKYFIEDKVLRNLILLLFLFGFWCAITSFWSDYTFVTLSRSFYFIFISFGAVLAGYLWQKVNPNSLLFLLPANILIIALCIFSLVTTIPGNSWSGGNANGFMGFAAHQNTLASVLLFTLPVLFLKIWNPESGIRNHTNHRLLTAAYSLLLTANLIFLIFTYSRASMLSLICGTIVFLVLIKKWNLLVYSFIMAVLIFLIIWFSPYLKEKSGELLRKDFPAFYSSREWLWVPSYKAALSGGIIGLGYGISNPEIIVEGIGIYDNGRYIREKGNSFLALTEEVGIIGFLLFILPLVYIILNRKSKIINTRHPVSGILFASLAAFLIHSQFEAWMVGVGSVQLPLFFFYSGSLINLFPEVDKTKNFKV